MYSISCSITVQGKVTDKDQVIFARRDILGVDIDNIHIIQPDLSIGNFIDVLSDQVLDDYECSLYKQSKFISNLTLKVCIKTHYQTINWYRPCTHLSENLIARLVSLDMAYEFDCNQIEVIDSIEDISMIKPGN